MKAMAAQGLPVSCPAVVEGPDVESALALDPALALALTSERLVGRAGAYKEPSLSLRGVACRRCSTTGGDLHRLRPGPKGRR